MNYTSISIDADLLEAVEDRTHNLDDRDRWIADAIEQLTEADDIPDRPDLDRDEYRRYFIETAIEQKLPN